MTPPPLLGWLALSVPAWSATPVVYGEGAADEAVYYVVERTGLPESQVRAVAFTDVLEAAPQVVGDGVIRRCAGPRSEREAVRAEVARARSAFLGGDQLATMDHLDLAVSRLGCLGEVAEGSVAAQAFLLRGAQLVARGDQEAAQVEITTALALDPDVGWPEGLPVEGQAVLQAVTAVPASATVASVPASTPGGPWVDGRELDGSTKVSPGLHLLQFAGATGIESGWLSVGGDLRIVLPRAFRPQEIAGMGSDVGNEAMAMLLAAALPEEDAVYVTHQGGLWLLERTTCESAPPAEGESEPSSGGVPCTEGFTTLEIAARPPPEVPPPLTAKERRRRKREARRSR